MTEFLAAPYVIFRIHVALPEPHLDLRVTSAKLSRVKKLGDSSTQDLPDFIKPSKQAQFRHFFHRILSTLQELHEDGRYHVD